MNCAQEPAKRGLIAVFTAAAACVLLQSTSIRADERVGQDWPFLRGPHFNGVSTERGWNVDWQRQNPTVTWRASVGIGAASVVVRGDRLVTIGGDKESDQDIVRCLAAKDGTTLWKTSYPCKFDARQFEGGPAGTPTIHDDRVYTLSYLGHVHCLDLASGTILWKRHLVDDFGGRYSSWKYAGSPLVIDGQVILDTGAEGKSTVALDRRTGSLLWAQGDDLAGYATPIPLQWKGIPAVLVFKARALVALHRNTGRELWRIKWKTYYDCNASTPSVVGDLLFVSTGYGGRSARGAVFSLKEDEPQQLWLSQDLETKMSSAVVYQQCVYCVSEKDGGQLMCFDLNTGKLHWSEPSFAPYGTLMIADGQLVVLDEHGELVLADATADGYRERGRLKVHDERCWVMPVLAHGRIYARSNLGNLASIDVRRKP